MTAAEGRAGPLGPPPSKAELPRRKILPHHVPGWVKSNSIFFVTICCQPRGLNRPCREPAAAMLFDAAAFRQSAGRWYVHLLLLLPDHLHALMSFPREENMRKVMANFKEITRKRAGIAWQRDFFDHRLRTKDSFQDKAWYILLNPVRQGLIENPERWPYVWRPEQLHGGPSGPALPCR